LPDVEKVGNDFIMQEGGQIFIFTGSNMAGKSTFLRTIGSNLCLAFAGGPVSATYLVTRHFRLYSCIRITDSVTDGISYFYAEVKCLRKLLSELEREEARPLLYFIDEIFRGTNNRERLIGGRAYIRTVADKNGLGLIATHDLELAKLAEEIPAVQNYHFREEVASGRMIFDYTLRPGPSPTTNALKIMALEGLPVGDL
jgi:DNA mismatch repair ATPase MutS